MEVDGDVVGIVTHHGALDIQVCVPSDWDDYEVVNFANKAVLCGTSGGWQIRKQGEYGSTEKERVVCSKNPKRVHIMLDA